MRAFLKHVIKTVSLADIFNQDYKLPVLQTFINHALKMYYLTHLLQFTLHKLGKMGQRKADRQIDQSQHGVCLYRQKRL